MNKENTKKTSKFVKPAIYAVALCVLILIASLTNVFSSYNEFFNMTILGGKVREYPKVCVNLQTDVR